MQGLEDELRRTIRLRPGTDRLLSRETSRLEFKESFSFGSVAAYLRTLASFANTLGGFLVFGISDSPRRVTGVDRDRFDSIDPARLATHMNTYFSPAINWSIGELEIAGRTIGFLHAQEHRLKPVVCRADAGTDLREGDIYYRYRGQTTRIKYPELAQIFEERLERERSAWREHLERIAAAGPTNVGVVDTVSGRMYGGGTTFLLDERLVERLKFMQEGSFTELERADPTLRTVGDVQPVGMVAPARSVPVAIHYHEIINAFLADRDLSPADALVYFKEACREDSVYVPVHFFISKAGLSTERAVAELRQLRGVPSSHRDSLRERIKGTRRVSPAGAVEQLSSPIAVATAQEFIEQLSRRDSGKDERSFILAVLSERPELVREAIDDLQPARLAEALTNLSDQVIRSREAAVKEILMALYLTGFERWESIARTTFRKAVARVDEVLYSKP